MNKGNVLVIGNSGVGKSTLINAVLGEAKAKTGWGTSGTTKGIDVYENDTSNFRLIDTAGFEPSFFKRIKTIGDINHWSKEGAKNGHTDNAINVIWFCVEGTSSKLFPETIKQLSQATSIWQTVPVIVVITKSYSKLDRKNNIEMVQNAFATQKRFSNNLKKVLPVVADTFFLNDDSFAAPEGIAELIEMTNDLMPEGIKAGEKDIAKYILDRKNALSQGLIATLTTSAIIVGATPISIADALILGPIEMTEVSGIAWIYNIRKDSKSNQMTNTLIDVGTVGIVAKGAIAAIKLIPGVNLAASVLDAVVAGTIVATLGEGSKYIFEQIYLGNKTIDDVDWAKMIMESKYAPLIKTALETMVKELKDSSTSKDIMKVIMKTLKNVMAK